MRLFGKIFTAALLSFIIVDSLAVYIASVKQISYACKNILEQNRIISLFLTKEIEVGYTQSQWPFENLAEVSKRKDFLFWWVVRDDGVIHLADKASFMDAVASAYFPQIANVKGDEGIILNHHQNYGIFVKALEIGKKRWLFLLGFSLQDLLAMKKSIIISSVLSFILILLILGVLLYFMVKYLTRPIRDLVCGTEIIGGGDLTYRVKIETRDELGDLGRSFNKMAEDLQNITVSRDDLAKEITERKQVEEALRTSENKYRTLLENLPQKVFLKDMNSVYLSCNESYARDLKINPSEITGKTDYEFYPKELAEKYIADDKRIMDSGKAAEIEEKYIQEGRELTVHTVKTPIKDEQGNVIGILGIFWDITEKKKAEEVLKGYTKKIEQINKELDDFTYIVSHDLKEPLRSIDAFSKFLEDDYKEKLSEDGRGYIERIRANATRMQSLIEDLLEISRIERKRSSLEEVDAEGLLGEVKLRLEYAIKEKNVEIVIQDNLPKIFCDRVRLVEVFVNLVSNAIKFNDKPDPRMEVGYAERDDYHEFYVKDNGPGIEQQYYEKIFEIFQRLGKREDAKGTGAGLTIVKKIIEMHRGKIWVDSKVGEYTTFYFTIPKKKEAILGKKKIGEILVEKKLVTKEELKKALEEQRETG